MKIDWFWLAVMVFMVALTVEGQLNKNRCFEALKSQIELKDCKQ